jgi:hypothetical protein
VLSSEVYLFKNRIATKWQTVSLGRQQSFFKFRGKNPPAGAFIHFYLKSVPAEKVHIQIQDLLGKFQKEITLSGKKGINKVRWNMQFSPAEEESLAFKKRLGKIIQELSALVKKTSEKNKLKDLKARLNKAQSEQALTMVHRQLTRNFGFYSEGRDLFGSQLRNFTAPAGEYRVTLTIAGKTAEGKLCIRNDPLLGN